MTEDEVAQLYQTYPRKVAKRAALKAIRAALKRAPYTVILEGVKRYAVLVEKWKRSKEWHPDVAYPATWFNGDRWDDEIEAVKQEPCPVTYHPGVSLEYCWRVYEPKWRKCSCERCTRMIERYVGKYDEYGQPYG